ncbi:MAG: alpha/beta hydrolase [Polyangiales bacterium]
MALPHQIVAPASPSRWALVLHGILGSKTNWRGIVRKAAESLPTWGFVLPDLRNHGDAQALPPPHDLDAVCDDLAGLREHLGHPFDAVIGHSYGAKSALAWVDRTHGDLDRAVIVDGNPGLRPDVRGAESTVSAIETLATMGRYFDTREAFVAGIMAKGFGRDLAQWMAMNLAPDDGRYRLRTDVDAIRAMLDDYFARDLWHVIEAPPGRVRIDVVIGGTSPALDASERARVLEAARRAPDRVRCVVIEGAGHWVHVDKPAETVQTLIASLSDVG